MRLSNILFINLLFSFSLYAETHHHEMEHTHEHEVQDHQEEMSHDELGTLGIYPINREASGTSWQPESTPHDGAHWMYGDWMMMSHGYLYLVHNQQNGPRGDTKNYSQGEIMLQGSRKLNDGTFTLRSAFSIDPLMGKSGYPLLFQTGETADGETHLVDRQHPHNFFVELGSSYAKPINDKHALFLYAGIVGEPALGPAVYMHRLSGNMNPEAPITHHWFDSTHITNGVLTLGVTHPYYKIEASLFRGREPSQNRYRIELGELDSYSARFTLNPTPNLSMQVSGGHLKSPEALEPTINMNKFIASMTFNQTILGGLSQTTLGFGRNDPSQGHASNAYLLESSWNAYTTNTIFYRLEKADKNELFDHDHLLGESSFNITKLSVGVDHAFQSGQGFEKSIGLVGSAFSYPENLNTYYGDSPKSVLMYFKIKI